MLKLITTTQFRKDYKRIKKWGYDMSLLEDTITTLLSRKVLAKKHQDHRLTGDYNGFRECHILSDWQGNRIKNIH